MKRLKKGLILLMVLALLTGIAPWHVSLQATAAQTKAEYKVEIVSFIRGQVEDLRCSELLEARIYKSTDNRVTWQVATDVEGTPLSDLSYTWTNNSANTPMVVFLTHDMSQVGLYGDTAEGTFQDGVSSTAVGGRWAAYKTPGVSTGTVGWPSFGRPGSGSSSSTSKTFSGSVTVQVKLPDGDVISYTRNKFGQPNLEADLNNIALGLFEGESRSILNLLGESAIVHITCTMCSVSNVRITDPNGCVSFDTRKSIVTGEDMGEATLSMTVNKQGCTVHNGQTASVSTGIFVFRKPETSTTTTTLTLAKGSLDDRCRYYINGVEGTKQADGSIIFTGLTPDTDYTVDVVATYSVQDGSNSIVRYAYAYVEDTTKPVYSATVNTYLDGYKEDVSDIHGEDIALYIKEENSTDYIYLAHTGTGTYSTEVDNGVYDVYHKEGNEFHKINDNHLIVANRAGSVDVHHYSVTYDPAGGTFANGQAPASENFAAGNKVTAVNAVPTRAGYVFLGWAYGTDMVPPGATVTSSITAPITLMAVWEREVNVSINITIDHTYTDPNGNQSTDSNNDSKDDVSVSLVARDHANAPYLEVPNADLTVSESSHGGHTLFVNGTAVKNYAAAGTKDITQTRFEEDATPTFTGLSAGKEYFVTVSKAGYDSTVTATKRANGDWVINVNLKFAPESEELAFEVKMDKAVPKALYPEAAIVKVLFYNTASGTWDIIAQHANGNPGVRVPITGQTGNVGSFPVWIHESGETTPYYYRMMVSAFVYQDGTIVPTEEAMKYVAYTDKNFTATAGDVANGKLCGSLKGAYFNGQTQAGTLDATITLQAYDVTFMAEGGDINGAGSAVARDQYYIPAFNQYQPTMAGHTFLGWWYKDANGKYTEQAKDGEMLTGDITLYALWDQTLEGKVTVSGTYEDNGQTLTVWEADRATQAMIVLQQITANSVNNLKIVNVSITWNGDTGVSEAYKFEGLDPMQRYRIEVIVTNYTASYQNTTTPAGTFEIDDYLAVYTNDRPWETFVNGKLTFEPEVYWQDVEVDASQIGAGFRPQSVMTQIWYTERGSQAPYQVITQHNNGGMNILIGADGKQNGTYAEKIWNVKFNGNLYDYQAYVSDAAVMDLPITVVYGLRSNFDTVTGQARNPLSVTLVPNRYNVILDMNTGQPGDQTTYHEAHTWSHATPVTYVPTREGYVFTGWKAEEDGVYSEANREILASVDKEVTLVAQWEKASFAYTVEYYFDGQLKQTETNYALFEGTVNPTFASKTTLEGKSYALDYVVGAPLTVGVNEAENVIKVYYGTDTISDEDDRIDTPDGIPDYYQITVNFEIVNGTWVDIGGTSPITRVFTLYTKNPNCPWTKLESLPAMGALPVGVANTGFENEGRWSPAVPAFAEESATYILSFNQPSRYSVTVIVVNGTVAQAGQSASYTSHVYSVVYNEGLTLNFTPNAEFALDRIEIDGQVTVADGSALNGWNSQTFSSVTKNHEIYVVYSPDTVGGGENGDEPDTVPDQYQKKITFRVVNGTWNGTDSADKVTYVTLMTDGKWDENGTANLPVVPTGMIANANFKKGTWNVTAFPQTVSGTDPLTFTHTFKPTAYLDYVYTVEHYKQQPNGIFVLAEREEITIPRIELNEEEDGFERQASAVTAVAKNYGQHYSEDTNHDGRVATGTPIFGQDLTLKLYYALDSHTVKYDLNGGNADGVDYGDATYLCGSTAKAKEAAHRHGYVFQGWKAEDGTVYQVHDVITVNQDILLTAQWTKQTGLSYTVRYLEENTNKVLKQETVVNNMTFGDVVNSLDHKADIEDYLFVYANPETLTIDTEAGKNIIYLYYTLDTVGGGADGDDSDNIPDKYQKKITFKVVNGAWNDGAATDKIVYVTLMANGKWDENGTAVLPVPAVGEKPATNFQEGQWEAMPPQTVSGTEALAFTYTYFRSTTPLVPADTVLYIVEHYKAENGSYPTTPTDVERLPGQIGTTVTAVAKDYDGYCVNLMAEGTVSQAVLKALSADSDIVILKLYYDADTVGGGEGGDESDTVPDKYQKKVIFKVVNGTWDDGTTPDRVYYLTLMTNDQWDINGTAVLETESGMIADAGYGDGAWNVTPPDVFSGTDEEVYTFTFEKAPQSPSTGDTVPVGLCGILMLSSAAMAVLILLKRKRRSN